MGNRGPNSTQLYNFVIIAFTAIDFTILFFTHSLDSSSQLFFAQLLMLIPYIIDSIYSIVPTNRLLNQNKDISSGWITVTYWICIAITFILIGVTLMGLIGLIRIYGSNSNVIEKNVPHVYLNMFVIFIPELVAIILLKMYNIYVKSKATRKRP